MVCCHCICACACSSRHICHSLTMMLDQRCCRSTSTELISAGCKIIARRRAVFGAVCDRHGPDHRPHAHGACSCAYKGGVTHSPSSHPPQSCALLEKRTFLSFLRLLLLRKKHQNDEISGVACARRRGGGHRVPGRAERVSRIRDLLSPLERIVRMLQVLARHMLL